MCTFHSDLNAGSAMSLPIPLEDGEAEMLFRSVRPVLSANSLEIGELGAELPRRLVIASVMLFMLAAAALGIDVFVCQYCSGARVPGDLRRILTWSEIFAHGAGLAIIALLLAVLDPVRRWHLPRILTMALGAGAAADGVKLLVGRFRPGALSVDSVRDSFAGLLPILFPIDGYERFDRRVQSFPSAHAAVATGLALALATVYPRGRYLFVVLAVLAAGQRIESGAHYLSDTLGGAAVGCLVAAAILRPSPLSRFFGRLEERGGFPS